jgi:dienelactone hydrolase
MPGHHGVIETREITYDADGLRMVGHFAQPAGVGPWPGVLIGHDGVGLNDYQRRRADHLAEQGYAALAMDYHGGRWFSDPQEMLARVLPMLTDPDRLRLIGRAALDVLVAQPGVDDGRLAALGYGAGATVVLELGRAGVAFRGIAAIQPGPPVPHPAETAAIRGAVLIGIGSEDPIQAPEPLRVFTRELQDAGVDWRMNIYGGAQHAFHIPPVNPDGSTATGATHKQRVLPGVGYHALHTVRAWRDVLDLFSETLNTAPEQAAVSH